MLWLFCLAYLGLPVGIFLLRYSVLFIVESLSFILSPFYILMYMFKEMMH